MAKGLLAFALVFLIGCGTNSQAAEDPSSINSAAATSVRISPLTPRDPGRVTKVEAAAIAALGSSQAGPPPPYEAQMLRLAEIMGALAFLRDLCGDGDGADYRAKFAALMEAEAHGAERRAAWAGAFNQSFEDYRLSYGSCTPNARAAIASFLGEANKIAAVVGDRYAR